MQDSKNTPESTESTGAAAPTTTVCHVCQVCVNAVCQLQNRNPLKQKGFMPCVSRVSAFLNLTYHTRT